MIVYPAIDIRHGKCVRLTQGSEDAVREYSSHPVEMALHWEKEGAEWLHIVDLDAAITDSGENEPVIAAILQAIHIPAQVGGGIRSLERIERSIALGASRVILGTIAVEDPKLLSRALERFGDYLAVGIDIKNDHVATRGWKSETSENAISFAKRIAVHGVNTLIVTDIAQDGMLTGPNFALTEHIASVTHASVILSGGIGCLEDLQRARALEERGVDGVIVGKALYEKKFSLKEALAVTSTEKR